MSAMKVMLIVIGVILVGMFIVGGCVYRGYDKVVTLDEGVTAAWAQVENQLTRRYDLLPNLVETVKGVASQEEEIFLGVAKARAAYAGAKTVGEKAQASSLLGVQISGLLSLTEKYPELKSNESFLKLQDSIEGTENRLSHERKKYNDAVRSLNGYTRRLFGRFCASLARVETREYFESAEEAKTAPKVAFSKEEG